MIKIATGIFIAGVIFLIVIVVANIILMVKGVKDI